MKTFLKKTVLLLFIFVVGILSFVLITHLIVKNKADFSISEEKKYLIFGHSHPECAFNDDLIEGFKNLSKSGESYFYTYHKVKEVLSVNNIDAIFIEYSNNLIDKHMDQWIWGYEKMNAYFPWHSPFMGKDDMIFLYKKNQQDFPKVISTSTRNNLTRILSFDFNIGKRYGSFRKLVRNEDIKFVEKINNIDKSKKAQELSIDNINYLKKIVEYCNIYNVKVYLIRSPQHDYYSRDNEEELLRLKNKEFESLVFLDFDRFPLEDNEFGDLGHLNHKGANVFSLWFNKLIKNGLLSQKNMEVYIYNEIKKEENTIKTKKY